jgi:hypothetical protein
MKYIKMEENYKNKTQAYWSGFSIFPPSLYLVSKFLKLSRFTIGIIFPLPSHVIGSADLNCEGETNAP